MLSVALLSGRGLSPGTVASVWLLVCGGWDSEARGTCVPSLEDGELRAAAKLVNLCKPGQLWPRFINFGQLSIDIGRALAQSWAEFGRFRANLDRSLPISRKCWSTSGQFWPTSGHSRSMVFDSRAMCFRLSVDFGRCFVEFGPVLVDVDRTRAIFGRPRVDFGRFRADFARRWKCSDKNWPIAGRICSKLLEIGPASVEVGRCRATFAEGCRISPECVGSAHRYSKRPDAIRWITPGPRRPASRPKPEPEKLNDTSPPFFGAECESGGWNFGPTMDDPHSRHLAAGHPQIHPSEELLRGASNDCGSSFLAGSIPRLSVFACQLRKMELGG